MSNLYNLEPQPTAKVVLQTTSGDITLELFAKQTPLASRSFLQHCLDGYYNNTIFHRLVPGFIVQGGDPTGSGSGGISALDEGAPFQDEFHSRLKYNRRGLLGMANEGKNSNGSQFFLTLAATPELQGRNTMFGRIEGDTIYNLMKMADVELAEGEGSERPLYPTKIIGAEILVNPFDDMVARAREAPRSTANDGAGKKIAKRKKPAGKNVLSFGGEDGEVEVAPVLKKAKVNPRFAAAPANDDEAAAGLPKATKQADPKPSVPKVDEQAPPPVASRASVPPVQAASKVPAKHVVDLTTARDDKDISDSDGEDETEGAHTSRPSALERTNAEIAKLKQSLKRTLEVQSNAVEKPRSALEAMIPASSTRGRKRGGKAATDEQDALNLFKAFKQRLEGLPETESLTTTENGGLIEVPNGKDSPAIESAKPVPASDPVGDEEEAALCDLHFIPNCQSCKSWDTENHDDDKLEDDDASVWMAHTLSFAKDTLGKDLEWKRKMQEIEVIDPREKARELAGERKRAKERPR